MRLLRCTATHRGIILYSAVSALLNAHVRQRISARFRHEEADRARGLDEEKTYTQLYSNKTG